MTRYYATCFDRGYLPKGVALYESLLRHSSADFCLYILALDELTRIELAKLDLKKAIVIECGYFEKQMKLAEAKASRTWQEWCWTCASQFCEFLMRSGLREVTYLDADLFMFADPELAYTELGECSIGITPHRFIPAKDYLAVNGCFNVGWITFRNTPNGRECLTLWAQQVRDRCSATEGCGDQKYLDCWPDTWPDVHIFSKGVNAGPWGIGNYHVTEGPLIDGQSLICYHLHEFGEREDGSIRFTNYELRPADTAFIYEPYLAAYRAAKERMGTLYEVSHL